MEDIRRRVQLPPNRRHRRVEDFLRTWWTLAIVTNHGGHQGAPATDRCA